MAHSTWNDAEFEAQNKQTSEYISSEIRKTTKNLIKHTWWGHDVFLERDGRAMKTAESTDTVVTALLHRRCFAVYRRWQNCFWNSEPTDILLPNPRKRSISNWNGNLKYTTSRSTFHQLWRDIFLQLLNLFFIVCIWPLWKNFLTKKKTTLSQDSFPRRYNFSSSSWRGKFYMWMMSHTNLMTRAQLVNLFCQPLIHGNCKKIHELLSYIRLQTFQRYQAILHQVTSVSILASDHVFHVHRQ